MTRETMPTSPGLLGPTPRPTRALLRGAPALLLAAGCFSEPPYDPKTGVVFAPSAAGEDAGGGTVTGSSGPAFALRFADGPGFHFPDSLTVGGTEILGREDSPGCFRENHLGVVIAPAARIDASTGAQITRNVLTPVLRGPAVTQVKVEWGTSFACNPGRMPGGASTFTVFPDGKIIRIDTIDDPNKSTINATLCACEEPQTSEEAAFHSRTYWTLARDGFTNIYVPDNSPDPRPLPAPGQIGSGGLDNQSRSCAQGSAAQVAFAWSEFRNTNIRGGGAVIGFDHELGDVGPSELDDISFKDRSAIFLQSAGATGCSTALARAQSFLTPPTLKIDGVDVPPSELDGIYGGDLGKGDPPGRPPVGADRVEVIGPSPAGFAVWVRFPHSVEGIRTTPSFSRPEGEWYLPQRVDDTSWIVWFRDTLAGGQTVTIEAR